MNFRFAKLFSISPLKIGLLITFSVVLLYFLNFSLLRFMELKSLDLRMVSRGEGTPGGEVVIAAIDEKSLSELGRWPWSRSTVAALVNTLKDSGARSVAFDVVFSEPENSSALRAVTELSKEAGTAGMEDPVLLNLLEKKKKQADTDAQFALAMKEGANVTLGYFFHTMQKDIAHLSKEAINRNAALIAGSKYPVVQFRTTPDTSPLVEAYAAVPNILPLSEAAQNAGYFNAFPDSDGVLRWSPLVIKFGRDFYPSMAVSALLQYLDWPMLSLTLGETGVEEIRIGDLEVPTDSSGRMLINYLGPGKTFPHYAVSDILNGRIDPAQIKDKIVLVGATATGIYDLRVTPYSAVFPGVEVHANVIDNILHEEFIWRPGWAGLIDVAAVLFFGIGMSVFLPRTRALPGMLLAVAAISVYIAFNIFLFSKFSLWLDIVYPALAALTVYLGVTVYKYVTEEREKKKIRNAFQHYLTSSVITEMLKDPAKLKLGGDKKDLSVLFSDIRGFTTISEKLTPEELVQLLNEYLTAMTNLVFKYEGLLDKYMGDAIMAVFGAPLDQPDHAFRACRTALGMMETLHLCQQKWNAQGKPALDIGIGINSGDMVVGNMGSEMRFDYTVMGDSVNLGSRLEGINKEYGTNIVISEFTYERVKAGFICRELDSVRVKGKHLPVRIYELLAEGSASDPGPEFAFIKAFESGLTQYKLGLWKEAEAAFGKVLEMRPADHPSEIYIRRCRELAANPPEGEWDGVYTMTKK